MPCIEISITKKAAVEQKDTLKERLGQAITLLSGKTEEYLMVAIQDSQSLYLAGRSLENGACAKVFHFGDGDPAQLKKLGEAILSALQDVLGIQASDAYVIFLPGIETWTLFGETYHADIFARK